VKSAEERLHLDHEHRIESFHHLIAAAHLKQKALSKEIERLDRLHKNIQQAEATLVESDYLYDDTGFLLALTRKHLLHDRSEIEFDRRQDNQGRMTSLTRIVTEEGVRRAEKSKLGLPCEWPDRQTIY